MADFNQAIILGNVTKDPEVRATQSGQSVASFSVATNRRWTNKDGQVQEDSEFHNVVAWGKLAEICSQILFKGRKVMVSGRLQTRNWEGQDGIKRYTTEIVAAEINAVGPARGGSEGNGFAAPSMPSKEAPQTTPASGGEEINLDDIPF